MNTENTENTGNIENTHLLWQYELFCLDRCFYFESCDEMVQRLGWDAANILGLSGVFQALEKRELYAPLRRIGDAVA